MVKKLLILCLLCAVKANAQTSWELLNPEPTANTGKEIEFVSGNRGYIITSNELLETLDSGVSWNKKRDIFSGNDLSFYNSTGYIAGNNGFLLKSSNNGESWNQVVTGFNFSYNTVNLIDENIIILSSSRNIVKSYDGGNTWESNSIPDAYVNKTYFTSELVGHAACNNGTMLKTIDGGLNWYETQSSNSFPSDFFTVYFLNENIGFSSREHDEIYKTIDGGETWLELSGTSSAIYDFHFLDENTGFITGEHGATFKTEDGGITWSNIFFQDGYIANTSMYGIYFEDSNIGYATGARGRIIKTTDGGLTWEEHSLFYNDINQIKIFESGVGYAQVGRDYYKTNDHGDNWTYVSTANHYSYCSGFYFVDENTGYSIGGGTLSISGDVFKTTNGGITWNKLEITVDEGLSSIYFINEDIGFISGGYNRKKVMKTLDGGNTWNKVLDTEFGNIQFLNTQVGYGNRIGYFGGRLYKTIDGGNTWDYILEVDQDINSFHFIDENIGYIIGDNALIQKTDDGGATWKELSIPYEYYELVKFYTEDIGFIVDEEGKIYKTEDGGENWKFLTIHYGTRSIELTNEHIFTAGSNGKIYRSETGFDLENEIDTDIFSIKVSHETCAGKNNGIILIETSEENEFSVSINGENYKFTQRLLLEDLPAENYSFCITTESNPDFEQCFESIIKPGDELEGRIQSQNQFKEVFVKVNIEKGTGPFLATLNGEVLGIYNSSTFTINTGKEGILEITSDKLCEGTLLFNIENTTSVFAYPNPTSSYINISIPETRFSQVPVSIYNNSGQLFYSDKKTVKNKTITLQVEDFSTGVYYVILKLETPRILKFYKK